MPGFIPSVAGRAGHIISEYVHCLSYIRFLPLCVFTSGSRARTRLTKVGNKAGEVAE